MVRGLGSPDYYTKLLLPLAKKQLFPLPEVVAAERMSLSRAWEVGRPRAGARYRRLVGDVTHLPGRLLSEPHRGRCVEGVAAP